MVQAAKKEQQFLKESGRNVKKYASITQQSYVAVCHGGGSQRPAESSHAVLRKNGNPPLKTPQLFLQLQLETLKATGIQKVRKYVSITQQSSIDFVPSDLQQHGGQHVFSGGGRKWLRSCQYTGPAILKTKHRTGENTPRMKRGVGLAKRMQKNWEKRALNITKRLHFVKKEVAKGNTKTRNGLKRRQNTKGSVMERRLQQTFSPDRKLLCARQCTCIFFGWKRAAPDGMSAQRRVRPSGCHNKTGAELQDKWYSLLLREMDTTKQSENYEGLLWRNCPRTEKRPALCQERNGSKPHDKKSSDFQKAEVIVGVIDATGLFQDNGTTLHCGKSQKFMEPERMILLKEMTVNHTTTFFVVQKQRFNEILHCC
ncbi:hypothetical protein T4B_7106 [Trichinella pseudospiralis]|uniref:Uncharacterized protein n=1 Tax=Trichinella pseudospiralis TaxID=6337 RepID=A0A0V1GQT7_TRIPS|nr:hypothetical protein T4B_7106 [Trichinella pseudospiralis]